MRPAAESGPRVHVDETIKQYIVQLTSATRNHPEVALGASPRATVALMRAAQAQALLSGRNYVIPDDVKALAVPVLAHRLLLAPSAQLSERPAEAIVASLVAGTPVPVRRTAAG
ncbi:MoxR family ATPase [Paenibacillus sp. P25]|nr:MoxR family ATPase [Paenibacillus sp. P25]